MTSSEKKRKDEELRKKIREQLQRKHAEKQRNQLEEEKTEDTGFRIKDESFYVRNHLQRKLELEIYGKHPQFVKCINHLGQIKWFTPLELENEFEYYPMEETSWERFTGKWFNRPVVKIQDTDEIKTLIQKLRIEMEDDSKKRLQAYKDRVDANKHEPHDETERKIIEEEHDLFYSRLKGYHKYKTYLGETAWLTNDEFEADDEFTDRVYSPKEILIRRTAKAVGSLAGLAIIYIGLSFLESSPTLGFVRIELGGKKASMYIDHNLAVGFTPSVPYPVEAGEHNIRIVASGYTALPDTQIVTIAIGDTSTIHFKLQPITGDFGYVMLKTPYPDAAVYVDGRFKGAVRNNDYLPIRPGDHSLTLKLKGYVSVPSFQTLTIHKGDTVNVPFGMKSSQRSTTTVTTSDINTGLIGVNSNINGAMIYFNGRSTGFVTDYVLQKIPFGRYVVRVEKESYKVYPKEQIITISKDSRNGRADFTLSGTSRRVILQTNPKDGVIFIDKKEAGRGRVNVSLTIGSHEVSFGPLPGYGTPPPENIDVLDDGTNSFLYNYTSKIHYTVTPDKKLSTNGKLYINYGYIIDGIQFNKSRLNAPEIKVNTDLQSKVWRMGLAFRHQSPAGKDAMAVYFRIPDELNLTGKVTLKLWIYRSKEKYPLVLGGTGSYQAILNNAFIATNKMVRYRTDEASSEKFDSITLNRYLKPGLNVLLISVSDENSLFLDLQKIEIE